MLSKKVCIINGSGAYYTLMRSLGFSITYSVDKADLVLFTGGEDVTPSLYGHPAHNHTFNNPIRDVQEKHVFEECRKLGIPMVGICRGGQFLNVMSGGEMYQHVLGHTVDHVAEDVLSGNTLWVSSTHHQMMKPSESAIIVTVAREYNRVEYWDKESNKWTVHPSVLDIESVYYPETRCLCFQPHPEFIGERYKHMKEYFNELLERHLFEQSVET